jgi:hypothetical protein
VVLGIAADVNLLKIPSSPSLPDDKVLFLSDIFATAWHANVLGEVADGDKVAIWGAGPGEDRLELAGGWSLVGLYTVYDWNIPPEMIMRSLRLPGWSLEWSYRVQENFDERDKKKHR